MYLCLYKQTAGLKKKSPEIKMIPRIDRINAYLDESIADIKSIVQSMEDTKNTGWMDLNKIFLNELDK